MKICNIKREETVHLAVFGPRGWVDATAAGFAGTMDEVIAGGCPDTLKAMAQDENLPVVEEPVFANVVNRPDKLVCVGLNYEEHTANIDLKVPEQPVIFSKYTDCLCASGDIVELPAWESSYDFEAELVIVMGREAFGIPEAEAADYIFGYPCGNDMSCRVPQFRSSQWLIGKTMPGFGPCGPCIVTADEYDPAEGKYIRSYVNGELRQDGSTADMLFGCARIVSYVSRYIHLRPGDLIFTGTPGGVALEGGEHVHRWLESGDRISVEIEGIGVLSNTLC